MYRDPHFVFDVCKSTFSVKESKMDEKKKCCWPTVLLLKFVLSKYPENRCLCKWIKKGRGGDVDRLYRRVNEILHDREGYTTHTKE